MQPIDQAWMMISSILPAKMDDKMNDENKYCQLQSRQATINQRPMASASWQYAWKHCMVSCYSGSSIDNSIHHAADQQPVTLHQLLNERMM